MAPAKKTIVPRNRKRAYNTSDASQLKLALEHYNSGTPTPDGKKGLRPIAQLYGVKFTTLADKVKGKHQGAIGPPLAIDDKTGLIIASTIRQLAQWGFPVGICELQQMVETILEDQNIIEPRLKDNCPGR